VGRSQEIAAEIEPIHRPSFSIGDSLGDIKVGVMHLKPLYAEPFQKCLEIFFLFPSAYREAADLDPQLCGCLTKDSRLSSEVRDIYPWQDKKPA